MRTSNCCTLFPFTKLLQSFMLSHCIRNQTLYFKNLPREVPFFLLAFNNPSDTVPECGSQHKILLYEFAAMYVILPSLLRLPFIRLRELAFSYTKGNQFLFHEIVHHHDVNVSKLLIDFDFDRVVELPTICQDFEKLFQMSTLKEVLVDGHWLNNSKIKSAIIVIGLQQQAQICSLQRLCFKHNTLKYWSDHPDIHYGYTETEFEEFWSAIFSLPHVDQLEMELDIQSRIVIDRAHLIYKCWKQFSFEKKN